MPKGIPGKVTIICSNCNKEKEHYALGLCRLCYRQRYDQQYQKKHQKRNNARSRKYYYDHREKRKAYSRQYRQEHQEERKAYHQEHYQKNRDRIIEQSHQYRENNREKYLESCRRSRQKLRLKHPQRYTMQNRCRYLRRKARERDVVNTLTPDQLEFERGVSEATYRTKKLDLHHIIPISKGGGHTWGNIMFIPPSLNGYIQNKLPEEVYKQLKLSLPL